LNGKPSQEEVIKEFFRGDLQPPNSFCGIIKKLVLLMKCAHRPSWTTPQLISLFYGALL